MENSQTILLKNNTGNLISYNLGNIKLKENSNLKYFDKRILIEEKENCIFFNEKENKCIKCSIGYKILNGECLINYSFKAIYHTDKRNENVNLINFLPIDLIEMIIDDKYVEPTKNYTFFSIGFHTVYALIDISKINSINNMLYKIDKLISISFTDKFNSQKIENMASLFSYCSSLSNVNLTYLNTDNVQDMSFMFSGCPSLINIDFSFIYKKC